MEDVKHACLIRQRKASATYLTFVLAVMLFVLSSAQVNKWTKQPSDPSFGVLGENVTLQWNFTLTGNDGMDTFTLQDSNKIIIVAYRPHHITKPVWVNVKYYGKFGLAESTTPPAFVLVNAEASDEAKYCCIVSTLEGYNNESCINLQILVRPSITAISRNQTWNETNDVTLSCNATGIPLPNVTWSSSGSKDMTYSGPVLALNNISREQDDEYWCTANNRLGNVTASVIVNVNYAPSITSNSTSYNLTEGNDIELYCVTDGRPQPTVAWTKIGEWSNEAYPDRQRLIITNANRTEAGDYMCTATNGIGDGASATIHVNMFFPASIQRGPANKTVNETSDLELFCNVTGNPPPNVAWSKVADPAEHLSVDKVLKVESVNKTDSGVYQCRASNGIGSESLASWTVTVNYKPEGTRLSSDAQSDSVKESFSVTFFCNANSVPPPELELRFDNSPLGLFGNGTFTLKNVNVSNQGSYECVPRNILGTGPTATLSLTVLVSPSIDFISQNTTVNETDDVMLFCKSTGNPIPSITWTFLEDSENVKPGEPLFLQHVNRSQAGRYRCTATNAATNPAWADVHVQVNYKPEIKDGPSVIKSWIDHETEVTCEAEGVPTPEIVWTRNGTVTSATTLQYRYSTLLFTPQGNNEFDVLLCMAKNLLGTANKNITVKELVVPDAPEILRIDAGVDNMEIHWEVSPAMDPDSPVLNYLVQVKEKEESNPWINCTRITLHKGSGSMLCVMNELKSGTGYVVRVAARNVVGYSAFTVKEGSTERGTAKKEEQKDLPADTVDGIIAGLICFLALLVVIFAIVNQRRSRSRGSINDKVVTERSKKITITSYDNPTLESEVPKTDAPQLIFNC